MKLKMVVLILVTLTLSGCMDDRIRRQTSLLDIKTKTAAHDFSVAITPEARIEIAQDYFKDAPAMTEVLVDYAFSQQPATKSIGRGYRDPSKRYDR